MPSITEFAPAKLNLYLHITGRRDDGYHHLDSLVTFADIGDEITLEDSETFNFGIIGPFAAELQKEDDSKNLVVKAAHSFADTFQVPLKGRLTLRKNLPIASGIGGGSSDAAAALRALARSHKISLNDPRLERIAAIHGQDVPVCLHLTDNYITENGCARAPRLPKGYLILINPCVPLSTPAVYRRYREGAYAFSKQARLDPTQGTLEELIAELNMRKNDLEQSAKELVPEIDKVLSFLAHSDGCRLSRMSGSGATCFGIFESETATRIASTILTQTYPNWWHKKASFPYGYML